MLTRVSQENAEPRLRALFAELKGCRILSLVQRDKYVTITLVALGMTEAFANDKELRIIVSCLTDRVRALVRLDDVRPAGVAGALDHVNKILDKK
jgi:hypothetical protein